MQKPSIPKGTRDFSPEEVRKRNYIVQKIQEAFQRYGFQPIETPSFERTETLMGKYGEEGDRLIFRILDAGDFLKEVPQEIFQEQNSQKMVSYISGKALRYDLTVPFARYVVQHQNEITFPFKRYQIQPVWRADRPQKGRYREFYQCDADVVGANGLWQEVEFVQLYDTVFSSLSLKGVTVKMNHRKILSGFAQMIEAPEKLVDFTVALDKLDKIGKEKVEEEMLQRGISAEAIAKIQPVFALKGSFQEKIIQLKELLSNSPIGLEGVADLEFIYQTVQELGLHTATLELDVTLARGLNYYTGTIFEVAPPKEVALGSIGGGGRYDELTEIFGLRGMSGIGISFGLDRIYLVMSQMDLFPQFLEGGLEILCVNFGNQEALEAFKLVQQLRAKGYKAELYPESTKLKKQLAYADSRQVKYVILIGEEELSQGKAVLKNMQTGVQETYPIGQVQEMISL
ncbi:histidine--tRNA ligase [uncultured Capnocytophaga sp.]|jgi:histidine--tRNA ligase|uniref:histidine--tRNA ligase n=1 Tax=uncultured Capnocytophaga sp. TaxID=159273 RepID=UPI0028EC769F|nr:histidine--tRNA ligase [uncultured Capnocytophaga sp.]